MGFQNGDGRLKCRGQVFILRLTLGGLAEISTRLSLTGPMALMQGLRSLQPDEGRVLLECLMRPAPPLEDARSPAADFTPEDIVAALPVICDVFEKAFTQNDN